MKTLNYLAVVIDPRNPTDGEIILAGLGEIEEEATTMAQQFWRPGKLLFSFSIKDRNRVRSMLLSFLRENNIVGLQAQTIADGVAEAILHVIQKMKNQKP